MTELSSHVSEDQLIGECLTKTQESVFILSESGITTEWLCQREAVNAFKMIMDMYINQREITIPTLLEHAEHKKVAVDHSYLNRCIDLCPVTNIANPLRKVKEMWIRREMIKHSKSLNNLSAVMDNEPEESIGQVICELADLTASHKRLTKEQIKEMIMKRYNAASSGGSSGIPLPWPTVNKKLGGLVNKQVTIFAGRGGIGKSMCCATLVHYLGRSGVNVGYLPFEDGVERTWARLASIDGKYSSFRMDCGASAMEVLNAGHYLDEVMKLPIHMEDRRMTAEQVMAWSIHQKVKNGMQLLVIDAFKDLKRSSRDVSEDDQMSQVITEIASRLDIPVWVDHHVRKQETSNGKTQKLTMDDIRGSANFVNDARQLLIAQNWVDDGGVHHFSFECAKNNNGPSGWAVEMERRSDINTWIEREIEETEEN